MAFHAYRALSAVVDLTGEQVGSIGSTAGVGLSLVSFTAGPRFSHRFSGGRFTPFVQGLVGSAHGFNGLFPNANGSLAGAANAMAVLAGGGLDLTMNRHLAIHAIQGDYLRTQLPNGRGPAEPAARQCGHRPPRLVEATMSPSDFAGRWLVKVAFRTCGASLN